jgi:hypothetical protein
MKFIENIKKHCASMELLYDFSEFKRITVLSILRFIIRIIILIPCFLIYLYLLVVISGFQFLGFLVSLPGQALNKIRANPGYDNKEYKWLYILSNLFLYFAVMVFDIILVFLPLFLALFSFCLDAVLWLARLGKSRFVNVNICFNEDSNDDLEYISMRASNRSFGEIVSFIAITLCLFYVASLIPSYDYSLDYSEELLLYTTIFLAILQVGLYIYYKNEKKKFLKNSD